MARTKTSVRVVVNALRKDGYKQAFGTFVQRDINGKVIAACALGQAALNLKVDPYKLSEALQRLNNVSGENLSGQITNFNDELRWPLSKIATRIERDWAHVLDETVEIER